MYNVVSNANTILDNVDAVNMSEEKKNLVKGQAKFLRAMAYRDLTDAWGAVPFITSLVKNPFTMNDATLTPVSEIEATLISDLKEGTIGSYRQKSGFSKKTSVKVEIPKEGYIKISNDPQDSAVVNIINSADLLIGFGKLAKTIKNFDVDSEVFSEALTKKLLESKAFVTLIEDGSELPQNLCKGVSDKVFFSTESLGSFSETIIKNLNEFDSNIALFIHFLKGYDRLIKTKETSYEHLRQTRLKRLCW